jgi:hypothetical protein
MSFISDLITPVAGSFIKDVGDTVKQFVTTDADRIKLEESLQSMQNDFIVKMTENANSYEGEITKRQQTDMSSDSWLSKNIRPLTLIFILGMYSLLSIGSAFSIKVTDAYVTLLGQWGMLIMSFYFGGRTLEKVVSSIKGNNNEPKS